MPRKLRIGVVAGEASGDILGAGLIKELRTHFPDLIVEGIGGELMQAEGCVSHYPLERLSVMGLVEVLSRLPELLGIRKKLIRYFIDNPPDLFIGIDAPDFTLAMEGKIKQAGIPTVHYVSPSVWAWKRKRIYKIKQTTDLLLTLFPFEPACYEETQQRVAFVGHPLAEEIAQDQSLTSAKAKFGYHDEQSVIAILPGSRSSETRYLAHPFLETARWIQQQRPQQQFLMPAANDKRYQELQRIAEEFSDLNLQIVLKQSRQVMAAADAILIASGTATLEATLLQKPMVVAYKMASLTYAIYSRMIKSPYISLPNLLAGEKLVPEILQHDVQPDVLGPAVLRALQDQAYRTRLSDRFTKISELLTQNASERAAQAIISLLQDRNKI